MKFEKLGVFHLGRRFEVPAGELQDQQVMYDARDLTTHGVCLGMTGSGKTGLCIGLLEEAAIDGVPTISLDPKGDGARRFRGEPGRAVAKGLGRLGAALAAARWSGRARDLKKGRAASSVSRRLAGTLRPNSARRLLRHRS